MTSTATEFDPDLVDAVTTAALVPRLLVACDFDGTISVIVDNPADARPAPGAIESLRALALLPGTTVALLSGRSRADLRALTGLDHAPQLGGILLIGSHGAEHGTAADAGFDDTTLAAVERLLHAVHTATDEIPGVVLETKPFGVAVHVRQLPPADAQRVLTAVLAGPARAPGVHVLEGKEVVELSVLSVDKGDAVSRLVRDSRADRAVVLGDDVTDEWAFAAARSPSVTVKVGDEETGARFRVPTVDVAVHLLTLLVDARTVWAAQGGGTPPDE